MIYVWLILFTVIGGPLTVFLHEASHALVSLITRNKIIAFKPYPHEAEGRRVRGCVYTDVKNRKYWHINHIAPLIKNALFIPLWIYVAIAWFPPTAILALYELSDVHNWIRGYRNSWKWYDGQQWKNRKAKLADDS